jgi:hypothetical protein
MAAEGTARRARAVHRDPWPWHLGVLGLFLVLGIAATWPLAAHFTTAVVGHDFSTTRFALVDQDVILWTQWWVYDSLFQRQASPFVTDLLYWPYYREGLSALLVDLQTWRAIVTAPVQATLGLIAAYNAGVLMSFVLGGWGAWLLAREAGASRGAAGLAGVVYVIGPYHLSQLHTEVAVVSIEAVPFALLWGWRALRGVGWPAVALAAACIVVANLLNWYYGAHSILALGLLAVIMAWQRRRAGWRAILPLGGRLLAVILLYAVLFSPILAPMLMQVQRAAALRAAPQSFGAQSGTYGGFNQIFVTDLGIRAASMHPDQFVRPRKDTRFDPPLWPTSGYPGVTAAVLALAALLWPLARRRYAMPPDAAAESADESAPSRAGPGAPAPAPERQPPILWGWVVVLVVFLILALGPDLHDLDGQPVRTDIPLLREIDRGEFVPLPYALLLRVPGMDLFRAPSRAAVMVTLVIGLLAALGAERLTTVARVALAPFRWAGGLVTRRVGRAALPLLAGSLMLAEYVTVPLPLYTPPTPAFFAALGQDPEPYGILELPITVHSTNDHRRIYNQTIHHKGIAGGYLSRPIQDPYRQPDSPFAQFTELYTTQEILEQDRDGAVRALLTLTDFRYLVAYKERRDYNVGRGSAAWDWPLGPVLYEDSQLRAYAVGEADLGRTWLYLGNTWSPVEPEPDGAPGRWVAGATGIIRLWCPGGQGRLRLTLTSGEGTRPVRLQLDEAVLADLTVQPTAQTVQTPRLSLARGWYALYIKDAGPPPGTEEHRLKVSRVRWVEARP